jgi:PAS domain-containing protein
MVNSNPDRAGGSNSSPAESGARHFQPEWCRVSLASIDGNAVITADTEGRVTVLNPLAESLTGWTQDEAAGVSLESVWP